MFTGKAKEKFDSWYNSDKVDNNHPNIIDFVDYPLSMKWGVIQDFGDSLGYSVWTLPIHINRAIGLSELLGYGYHLNGDCDDEFDSRQEARTAAIEKLNSLINKL